LGINSTGWNEESLNLAGQFAGSKDLLWAGVLAPTVSEVYLILFVIHLPSSGLKPGLAIHKNNT
jgi:hypothetical protein